MEDVYEENVILHKMRAEFVHKEIEVWGFDYISDLFDSGFEPELIRDDATGEHRWVWKKNQLISAPITVVRQ